MPFRLVHGESLVACASWALGEAGVTSIDLTVPWVDVLEVLDEPGSSYVLHDALCPLTPPAFLTECAIRAAASGRVVVGVRPVTDTVKELVGDLVGGTVDRESLVALASPVAIPAAVAAELTTAPAADLVALVTELRGRYDVEFVEAPPAARRVTNSDELRLLESLTHPGR